MLTTDSSPATHIVFLLDRSGSMASIARDVIQGFNTFLAQLRADGADARVTLVQFDSEDPHEVVFDAVPIVDVPNLSAVRFVPRGGTPLYDAIGRVVTKTLAREGARAAEGEARENVVFVILTDGAENASRELTRTDAFGLLAGRREAGWVVVYIGANQDAFSVGAGIGVQQGSATGFVATAAGTALAFEQLSRGARRLRRRAREEPMVACEQGGFFDGEAEGPKPTGVDSPSAGSRS